MLTTLLLATMIGPWVETTPGSGVWVDTTPLRPGQTQRQLLQVPPPNRYTDYGYPTYDHLDSDGGEFEWSDDDTIDE